MDRPGKELAKGWLREEKITENSDPQCIPGGEFNSIGLGELQYAIVSEDKIIFWRSFEEAGIPEKRFIVETKQTDFLDVLGKWIGRKYVRLPYRCNDREQVFHKEPVPDYLMKPPTFM